MARLRRFGLIQTLGFFEWFFVLSLVCFFYYYFFFFAEDGQPTVIHLLKCKGFVGCSLPSGGRPPRVMELGLFTGKMCFSDILSKSKFG